VKAIRGATAVDANTPEAISSATRELLREIAERNGISPGDVISMFFTMTPDLDAHFPAAAARAAGWDVPMLDMQEAHVAGALDRCLRVLIHVDHENPVRHVYLGAAADLRPDLADSP